MQAGGYDETRDTLGVSDFVAAMLRRGTKTRSADDIARAIDFVGGTLDAQATSEGTTTACSALSKDAKLCLDLLSDMLLHPSFPESEMGEVRDEMLAAIAARFDNPHELANTHFANLMFGEQHPDGWVLTAEDVRKITRARLETFWKTFYRPNRAMLAVAGDIDAAKLRAGIEKQFGGWARAAVPPRPEWTIPKIAGTRILLVDRPDSTQATIVLGHQGIKHADPRWYAATLMNYVLGGSDFSSRLMIEVRAKRGLTYGIGSSFGNTLYESAFRGRGVDEERVHLGGAARRHQRDPPHEDGRADRGRAGQGEGLLRGQLPVQAADRGRASRRRWSPPICTAWARATCASCRCGSRRSTKRRPRRRRARCCSPTRCWS